MVVCHDNIDHDHVVSSLAAFHIGETKPLLPSSDRYGVELVVDPHLASPPKFRIFGGYVYSYLDVGS